MFSFGAALVMKWPSTLPVVGLLIFIRTTFVLQFWLPVQSGHLFDLLYSMSEVGEGTLSEEFKDI